MQGSHEFFLPFLKSEKLSKDGYAFYFDRSKAGLDFLPGQFIRMELPHDNMDERGNKRYFSIVTSPTDKNTLGIVTRIIQSSFKKTLLTVEQGNKIKFFGPLGRFILKEDETYPRVFLAGGVGITPFHSMILYANEKKLTIPLTLFVSFSTVEELLFYQDLSFIAKENSLIKIIYTVTHLEEPRRKWGGETGRISEQLIRKYVQNVKEPFYYIAGPPNMNIAIRELVKKMGVEDTRIRTENFAGY